MGIIPVGLLGPPLHLLVAQGSLWLNLRSHNHPPYWHEHPAGYLCTGHDRYRVRHLRAMGKLRDAVTLPRCSSGHPPMAIHIPQALASTSLGEPLVWSWQPAPSSAS